MTTSPIGRKQRNKAGFTLIELLLSVLIIAILVGMATPLFRRQFTDLELRNSAYNIAKLISYAQRKAIGEQKYFKINFDYELGKYWLAAGEDIKEFKRLKHRYGKKFSLPEGIAIRGEKKFFIFFPNGRSEKIEITVSSKKRGLTLKTKGSMGHVEIEPAEKK